MQELDDIALLREYVERDSEPAFAELVTRHIDRVYSVALRHGGNPHQAEEITQAVFVILARKASRLRKGVILEGWLYQTTRLTALTHIRSDIRRARREQEAHMQTVLNENESEVWSQITPLLDGALAGLNEPDRNAVVMRFFYGKSMKEIGTALGANEDTARMRINRALEKLRKFFAKGGVVSTTATIAGAISTHSVQAAPAAPAKTATAVALAKGATASASTLTLIKGALKFMAWTKAKTAIVGAVIVGMVTLSVIQEQAQIKLRQQNETLQRQQAPLSGQIQQLQRERDDAANRLKVLVAENEQLKSNKNSIELLKLRGQVTQLKTAGAQKENDPTESAAKSWAARVTQLKQRLTQTPEADIPELQFVSDEDWLNAGAGELNTEEDYRKAYALLRQAGKTKYASDMLAALQAWSRDNGDQLPTDLSQLGPYFKLPVNAAILQRWTIVPGTAGTVGNWSITEKAPVDEDYDTHITIGLNRWETKPWAPGGTLTMPLRQ